MVKKSLNTIDRAERLMLEAMSDEELEAIVAENPDLGFQALLEKLTDKELDNVREGDLTPLYRRGWAG